MVCPIDSEIGDGFAPFSISSKRGPKTIHRSPYQGNKNNKGLGRPPRASSDTRSSSILVSIKPPEASIQGGFATNPISRAGHADSTPGTKSHGLLALAMKKIAKFFKL
ncbi:PREDICTED: uncharacterized protein LOC103330452 isoform X2 [Prunus mume]|uniref:Uncharacterized protein LOC103330452 isoform X2 n=1 Tax=Prunus mume TaxID=102107 RepID=A0ABM0NXH3_PRUMU|nr:PREDICTED: uncharacterized protein LOC103330452 isoform X2 [Prunus mume]XP_008231262.1 PREDICTED: uncharacterized protein LOC103330452 isoform X2 [Prunus mume]